jgi:branched-chain amino acid transport system substrate-binding protein
MLIPRMWATIDRPRPRVGKEGDAADRQIVIHMRRIRRVLTVAVLLVLTAWTAAEGNRDPIVVGAVYPTAGPQGGTGAGADELHGFELAAVYVNAHGGIRGRPIQIRLSAADSLDAAADAVEHLARQGVTVVAGSYGSTIARPAAEAAARLGLVFWETGAVGEVGTEAAPGRHFFRVAPSGALLGREAVAFVRDQLTARLDIRRPLRYTVAYVDDAFGRAEANGEVAELRRSHLPLGAVLAYDPWHPNYKALVAEIARTQTDVLIAAGYMEDAVGLRHAIVSARVPLAVTIGGCSAFIMPEFGRRLGREAVGVFASDKTGGDVLPTSALSQDAAGQLVWARQEFRRRYGHPLWEPGLSGFSGGIALFQHVLPRAPVLSAAAVAAAIQGTTVPVGGLPNGSGLAFAPPGAAQAGENLRAVSVIWQWVAPYTRALVWPPAFATHAIVVP